MKRSLQKIPLLNISNATFYRRHPSTVAAAPPGQEAHANPPLFPNLTLSLPSSTSNKQHWSVLSSSSSARTSFLEILRGQHLCFPPTARTYPYLTSTAPGISAKGPRVRSPSHAIRYVGFDAERGGLGGSTLHGSYLSARYESRREETDFSVLDYLKGNTELNPAEDLQQRPPNALLDRVIADLRLDTLLGLPVANLSNGQTRRARIAKALLEEPELLLLDGPFMGLDPRTVEYLSSLLHRLADTSSPRLFLSLHPHDHLPEWITHVVYTGPDHVATYVGPKEDVFRSIAERDRDLTSAKSAHDLSAADQALRDTAHYLRARGGVSQTPQWRVRRRPNGSPAKGDSSPSKLPFLFDLGLLRHESVKRKAEPVLNLEQKALRHYLTHKCKFEAGLSQQLFRTARRVRFSRDGFWPYFDKLPRCEEPLVEMEGVKITYSDKVALGDWQQRVKGKTKEGLWWTVRRGQRWGIFGPNGSGKTTLISLLTSDHPQAYSAPLRLFGRSRLPKPGQPGISLFELQSNIGHASPEIHALFPKHLTVREALESAWADTPLSRPNLTAAADRDVDAALLHFTPELAPGWTPPNPPPAPEPPAPTLPTSADAGTSSDASPPAKASYYGSLMHVRVHDLDYRSYNILAQHRSSMLLHVRGLRVDAHLSDAAAITWADRTPLAALPFAAQRLVLFLRALVRQPALVVLDEALSGVDAAARDKALAYLSWGPAGGDARAPIRACATSQSQVASRSILPKATEARAVRDALRAQGRFAGLSDDQALVVVSHRPADVPGCVREWMTLPEPGEGRAVRMGALSGPLEGAGRWEWVWGTGAAGVAEREGWEAVDREEEVDVEAALVGGQDVADQIRESCETRRREIERAKTSLEEKYVGGARKPGRKTKVRV